MWSEGTCSREAEVRKLAGARVDDPELRAHVADCSVCRDTLAVAAFMHDVASHPVSATPLPNPDYLWWKAQILRRWEAERAVVQPIEVGERVQVGIGLAGAVALLFLLWREIPAQTSSTTSVPLLMVVSGIIIALTAVIACLTFFNTSDTLRS